MGRRAATGEHAKAQSKLKALIRVPSRTSEMANHIERNGVEFFRLTCQQDLEGIVAKLRHGKYGEDWFKIRNPAYSQQEGRRELFEEKRAR